METSILFVSGAKAHLSHTGCRFAKIISFVAFDEI